MIMNTKSIRQTENIVVQNIDPSPYNRHVSDDDPDIAELAKTIVENGLICPISIRPRDNDRYEIICGERRWRAFRLLGEETIPCFVKDLDDTQAQIEAIVENFQRRDPTYLEQGEAVAALMKLTNRDVAEIANRLGQSPAWVYRRARLPNLISAWRDELAQESTPYIRIRESVNKLEEIAILPPAMQQLLLEQNTLRDARTIKDMRKIIGRYCMELDKKPWTRDWERKAYSGSSKKRCSDCMKRSDRINALFPNPDAIGNGKKMCMDQECWQGKCLAWCQSRINNIPGAVPIHENYVYNPDREKMENYFGIQPLSYWQYQKREEGETENNGYIAGEGIYVDGSAIGSVQPIWIPKPSDQEENDDEEDNKDIADIQAWRERKAALMETRQLLFEAICREIVEYLANVYDYISVTSVELFARQLRACCWFGINESRYNDDQPRIDDPEWHPFDKAWAEAACNIAEFIAQVTAETTLEPPEYQQTSDEDKETASALCKMFEIPLDMITTKGINSSGYVGNDTRLNVKESGLLMETDSISYSHTGLTEGEHQEQTLAVPLHS